MLRIARRKEGSNRDSGINFSKVTCGFSNIGTEVQFVHIGYVDPWFSKIIHYEVDNALLEYITYRVIWHCKDLLMHKTCDNYRIQEGRLGCFKKSLYFPQLSYYPIFTVHSLTSGVALERTVAALMLVPSSRITPEACWPHGVKVISYRSETHGLMWRKSCQEGSCIAGLDQFLPNSASTGMVKNGPRLHDFHPGFFWTRWRVHAT